MATQPCVQRTAAYAAPRIGAILPTLVLQCQCGLCKPATAAYAHVSPLVHPVQLCGKKDKQIQPFGREGIVNLIQYDPDCFICRKHRKEIHIPGGAIYEDDLVYIGHAQIREGQATAYLGYLMVEPKRHVPGVAELTDVEAQAIGLMVARLSKVLKASEKAEHVYVFVLGDFVHHLHVHVVPRYPGAPREYWGIHVDEWPGAPRGGAEEIDALCMRLREKLKNE